jgi:hypothetical protein
MHPEAAVAIMLIFIVAFLGFLSLIFFLRHREALLRHQERVLALEKGMPVPLAETRPSKLPRIYLLRGLQWLFVGFSISLMLLATAATSRRPMSMSSRIASAQFLRMRGASEEQLNQYLKSPSDEMEGMAYSVASIGLVPMSVGLAYLVFYRKESEGTQPPQAR